MSLAQAQYGQSLSLASLSVRVAAPLWANILEAPERHDANVARAIFKQARDNAHMDQLAIFSDKTLSYSKIIRKINGNDVAP